MIFKNKQTCLRCKKGKPESVDSGIDEITPDMRTISYSRLRCTVCGYSTKAYKSLWECYKEWLNN